jgi:hypothetical protein
VASPAVAIGVRNPGIIDCCGLSVLYHLCLRTDGELHRHVGGSGLTADAYAVPEPPSMDAKRITEAVQELVSTRRRSPKGVEPCNHLVLKW